MIKQHSNRAQIRVALLLIVLYVTEIHSQGPAKNENVLPPPKANLVALHLPDLTTLEAEVREHLTALQNELAATVKDPKREETLSEAYGTMGEIYQAYSLTSPARECYLNASRLAPKDFRWTYLLGTIDQQEGRFDEAIRSYQTARTLQPDYEALAVNLGNVFLQLNRLEDGEASFKSALAISKSNAAAYYGLGQVALSQRKYAQAIDNFEKTLVVLPGANRVHYSLAMAYRGLGDATKAKEHLAQQGTVGVRVVDPLVDRLPELIKGERLHLIRGRMALDAKRYADAAGEFRKAIDANPESVTARNSLAGVLTLMGILREAAAQYEATLRIDPKNVNANYNLAILLAKENKHELAIAHLQSVVKVDPNDVSARNFLGQQLLIAGHVDEALVEFSRVVASDPNNEEALLNRVKLLLRTMQYKLALDQLEMGHANYPQKGQTAVMLAYLLAASPQYDLRDGTRALKLALLIYQASSSLKHGVLVAMSLAELGRCSEAAEWQRKLIAETEEARQTDLVARLRASLKRYAEGPPCRPVGEFPLKTPGNQ